MVKTRWSAGKLLVLGVCLFLGWFLYDLFLYGSSPLAVGIASILYALFAGALTLWALRSIKIFKVRFKLARTTLIWGALTLIWFVVLLILINVPENIMSVFSSRTFLADTLVALSAGILEEFVCRGALLSGFLKSLQYREKAYQYTRSVIYAAILFGAGHLINLIGGHPDAVFKQIFWAIALGVFLGAVRITTNTLTWVAVIHFLIDWVGGGATSTSGVTAPSWLEVLAIFGPLLVLSVGYLIVLDRQKQGNLDQK